MANKWKNTARGQALMVLEEVFQEGAYSNIALNKQLKTSTLSDQDKGLVTELVYGTVARKMTLEWLLAHYIEDRDKLQSWVYDLLLLSLYQLSYLDKIPAHAVVNSAVDLAKERGHGRGAEKLVNGVLRKIIRDPLPDPNSIKRVNKRYSILYSLPVWLVKKLIDQYGEKRAVKIFESLFVRNKASVRVINPDHITEIAEKTGAEPSQLSSVGLTKPSGVFAATDYFKTGQITIQDETSQLVAPALDIQGDDLILDACAAPGGKTVHMASYLTTGTITALDLYDHKLGLIRDNAERLGLSDKIQTYKLDASLVAQHFPKDHFDKILVDAPCSGIGLIRRKPDIKYNKELQDFSSLQETQLEILASVCQTLKKGGIMVYSTCTIVPEENQEVVAKFLASHPNFEQVELEHKQKDIVLDGCLLITPEQYGTDGFFIAKFRRLA